MALELDAQEMQAKGQFARDKELEVRFFKTTMLHVFKDEATGTEEPRLREVDAIEIKIPSDPTRTVVEQVVPSSTYLRRFPEQWKAYQSGAADQANGTKLDGIGLFNPMEIATMQLAGYRTVEQLLGAPFHAIARIGPGSAEWQTRVKQWHANQSDSETLRKMIVDMQTEIAALKSPGNPNKAKVA